MEIKSSVTLAAYDKVNGFKKAVIVVDKGKSVRLVNEKDVKSSYQKS